MNDKGITSFILGFEGASDMNAGLLGTSISDIAYCVDRIMLLEPTKPTYELRVKGLNSGSVEIVLDLSMLAVAAQTIMPVIIPNASVILTMLKNFLDIKKHLKGERPKSVVKNESTATIDISFPDGSEMSVPYGTDLIFRDQSISQKIGEIARVAQLHDPQNGGIKLIGEGVEAYYSIEDTQYISMEQDFTSFSSQETTSVSRVTLPIKMIDFLGDSAWQFKYGNVRNITAKVEDPAFLQSVRNGSRSYKAGDMLDVDLETTIKYAADGQIINEKYSIAKVHQVLGQTSMY